MRELTLETLTQRLDRVKRENRCCAIIGSIWLVSMLVFCPGLAFAQMYRWVDDQGKVHYSESLESIPEGFRSRATPLGSGSTTSPPAAPEPTATAPDTPESRRAAAERYLAVFPVQTMLTDTMRQLAQTVPESDRQRFVGLMSQMIRVDWLNGLMLDLAAKHFSVHELDALAAFYGSADGQAILKKMGPYMGEALPLIQAEVLRAANEARAKAR